MDLNQRKSCLAFVSVLLFGSFSEVGARDFPHEARVIKVEQLTPNIKRITFMPKSKGFKFTAGQYIYLKAPDSYVEEFYKKYPVDEDATDSVKFHDSRPYSFASSPSRSSFDLIIKHYGAPRKKPTAPPGVVSSYVHKHLKVGDVVHFSSARGTLYSPEDSERPIVLLAGGVGASPLVGLLNYFFENKVNEKRKIYFFLGVRSRRDLLLDKQFTEWSKTKKNFYYVPTLSNPQPEDNWEGEKGYPNVVFDRHFKDSLDAEAYIAGPKIMVEKTTEVLKKKGVPEERIHHDRIKVGEDE